MRKRHVCFFFKVCLASVPTDECVPFRVACVSACEVGADFVAASFIRTASNVRSVVAYLDRCVSQLPLNHADGKTPLRPLVISKIESKEGVDNFEDILEESDGIMVARGDLGVEIPYSKVFAQQKRMVSACNEVGKPGKLLV